MWFRNELSSLAEVSLYFVGDYNVQKNLSLTLIMSLTKTIQSSHPISFKHWILHYPLWSPTSFLLLRFSKHTLYYLLLYYVPHMFYLPNTKCVNNIWWRVTVIKLTTESSASKYSYPLPHQIFSSPPCSHKPSICILLLT